MEYAYTVPILGQFKFLDAADNDEAYNSLTKLLSSLEDFSISFSIEGVSATVGFSLYKQEDQTIKLRQLVVDTASYWFAAARNDKFPYVERLLYLENALNHTENALICALENEHPDLIEKWKSKLASLRKRQS